MASIGDINNLGKLNLFADEEVLDDILAFHQKTTYLLDQRFAKYGQFPISAQTLAQLEFTDNEVSPFFHDSIKLSSHSNVNIRRNYSNLNFTDKKMPFSDLSTLLTESFLADANNKRPYPSGGGLYPADVFVLLMQDRMIDAPASGVYHYRPSLGLMQQIKKTTTDELYSTVFAESVEQIGSPCVCFVYTINLQKAVVKYNYRGYRNAILEVGSMYQQADLVAQALSIRNRLSSSFSDQRMTKFLELDRQTYLPLVMQYFGY